MKLNRFFGRKRTVTFPCPACGRDCEATENKNDGTATINHPGGKLCMGLRRTDLLRAYVMAANPKLIYPPMTEIPESWKN